MSSLMASISLVASALISKTAAIISKCSKGIVKRIFRKTLFHRLINITK